MPYSTREKVIYGTFGFVVITLLFFSLPTLIAVWMNYKSLNNIQDNSICASKPSDLCFTGNACLKSGKQKMCPPPDEDNGHHHSHARHWSGNCTNQYFCTEPIKLADGSCCDEDDVCYLPDPKKTCRSGECVSKNYSLCKGSCTDDVDCDAYPMTLSPNVLVDSLVDVCFQGSCVRTVRVAYNYPDPSDILDKNTTATKRDAACISVACVLAGDPDSADFPWQCTLKRICTRNNPQVAEP